SQVNTKGPVVPTVGPAPGLQLGVGVAPGAIVGAETGKKPAADGERFQLERTISIHEAPVHSVAMSTQLNIVATASWDATINLYNLSTDKIVRTLGGSSSAEEKMGGLYAVAFSKTVPDILGCTSCDKNVYLWNHQTGKPLAKLGGGQQGHQDEVNGIDFHSSQQVMCTASDDKKVIIWDFQEGIVLRTLETHTKAVYGSTFLGQEMQYFVATCCFDMKTRIFDMRDKQVVALLQEHTDDIIGIDYSSAKGLIATGSDDGNICIWNTRTWKLQHKINTRDDLKNPDNEVKRVSFSPDGMLLAAACSSGSVQVYDMSATPKHIAKLGDHKDCVFDVCWGICPTTRAKMLVSASHDRTSMYWREVL
ncbi:unnamed protein product, partial [Polarella glacialis]